MCVRQLFGGDAAIHDAVDAVGGDGSGGVINVIVIVVGGGHIFLNLFSNNLATRGIIFCVCRFE